jgi:hypothetical protein
MPLYFFTLFHADIIIDAHRHADIIFFDAYFSYYISLFIFHAGFRHFQRHAIRAISCWRAMAAWRRCCARSGAARVATIEPFRHYAAITADFLDC